MCHPGEARESGGVAHHRAKSDYAAMKGGVRQVVLRTNGWPKWMRSGPPRRRAGIWANMDALAAQFLPAKRCRLSQVARTPFHAGMVPDPATCPLLGSLVGPTAADYFARGILSQPSRRLLGAFASAPAKPCLDLQTVLCASINVHLALLPTSNDGPPFGQSLPR